MHASSRSQMEMEGGDQNNYVVYGGACARNYAVQVGRVIHDGCQEFARDALGSRYCEACGCDQNFHMMIMPSFHDHDSYVYHMHAAAAAAGGSTGGRNNVHRSAISQESGITMVRLPPDQDDHDHKVKLGTPHQNIVDHDNSTATSKKKQNKKKK